VRESALAESRCAEAARAVQAIGRRQMRQRCQRPSRDRRRRSVAGGSGKFHPRRGGQCRRLESSTHAANAARRWRGSRPHLIASFRTRYSAHKFGSIAIAEVRLPRLRPEVKRLFRHGVPDPSTTATERLIRRGHHGRRLITVLLHDRTIHAVYGHERIQRLSGCRR